MAEPTGDFEAEFNDLKRELDNFEKEKERVRLILGRIGGVSESRTRLINGIFIGVVVVSVIVSLLLEDAKWRLIMIEVATITLSVKIIYLMHYQVRVNHFQFWILSAIEWRINEMMTMMRKAERNQERDGD